METARVFENGGSLTSRFPKESAWRTFINGLESFTDDFMKEGRDGEAAAERPSL